MNESVDISENIIKQKKKIKEIKRRELLNMIMRQTNYTEEETIIQLKKWNYNSLLVMKAYLNPNFMEKKANPTESKSLNQRVMTEIRGFCDKGAHLHRLRQEMAAKISAQHAAIPQQDETS